MASATTKLESVNQMLSVINEASVTTITGTLSFEVSLAVSILDETVKELTMEPFVFNSEKDLTLTPDVSDNIVIPGNYVQVRSSSNDYVVRSGLLYSMVDKTSTFTKAIQVDVVYMLDFEDIPEAAKRYCTIRAARIYADRLVGAKDVRAFTQLDEVEAKAKLNSYQFGIDKPSLLKSSGVADILDRSL